jgi:hypothetical protein
MGIAMSREKMAKVLATGLFAAGASAASTEDTAAHRGPDHVKGNK